MEFVVEEGGNKVGRCQTGEIIHIMSLISCYFLTILFHLVLHCVLVHTCYSVLSLDLRHVICLSSKD